MSVVLYRKNVNNTPLRAILEHAPAIKIVVYAGDSKLVIKLQSY